jgi:hypothetical protein
MTRLERLCWFLMFGVLCAGVWRIGSQPVISLTTPTQTVIHREVVNGLPDFDGMKAVKR